jgi:PAS domain S-box-containing protein
MGETGEVFPGLGMALESLLEFIGATAGWVCLRDESGGPTFPVRRGEVPDTWLRLQQSRGSVWGFAVREGPTLLNDLRPWAALGEPPLHNLLSCPLGDGENVRGHVALANKPQGFASQDAAVLQGMAHHMLRLLGRPEPAPRPTAELPAAWRRILDRAAQGILVLDESGALLYANATWLDWTGFRAEDLLGRQAPFPFWVSQHDLVRAMSMASAVPTSAVPFRRRDQSLLWCQVETVTESWRGRPMTVAFLQQTTALAPTSHEGGRAAAPPPVRGDLPFGVAVTDRRGRLLWSNAALARLAPGAAPGQPLHTVFAPAVAAVLEHLLHEPRHAELGRMGSLVLPAGADPLSLYWLTVPLGEGLGFLFALTDEPEGFPFMAAAAPELPPLSTPVPEWLALILEMGNGIDGWGPPWEKLTGLSARDVEGSRTELVLDWLFPQQHDRDRVTDCFHQTDPSLCQMILEIATPTGGRPLACTFLSLPKTEATGGARRRWLLLAGEPEWFAGPGTASWGFVRQFTQGLHQVLLHHLRTPGGLARLALERGDLPAEMAEWFRDIDAACRRMDALLEDLENLSLASAGECRIVSLAQLVREFLDEHAAGRPEPDYELRVDLPEEPVPVRVNPRLLRVVLHHLLTNAEQALVNGRRQIEVRVRADADAGRCEIRDTGEGLPMEDWTRALAPFFSTKGAFARDAQHAAVEATGLGLTVSRHLLTLHEGQLDLRSVPGEGTTAIFTLPRADRSAAAARVDPSNEPRRPHPHEDGPITPQIPPLQ